MLTVREFVFDVFRVISAQNPTTPLHGDDQKTCIRVLNRLLNSFSGSGLMTPIAQTHTIPLLPGTSELIAGDASYLPTPDLPFGRLANLQEAWLTLNDTVYPLVQTPRDEFLLSWRSNSVSSLPRFIIVFPENEITRLELYPKPAQQYDFNIRGKFQLNELTSNDDMSSVPMYMYRFLVLATAKDTAIFTGRAEAWTENLEQLYNDAWANIEGASELSLSITGGKGNDLSGAALVIAGTR